MFVVTHLLIHHHSRPLCATHFLHQQSTCNHSHMFSSFCCSTSNKVLTCTGLITAIHTSFSSRLCVTVLTSALFHLGSVVAFPSLGELGSVAAEDHVISVIASVVIVVSAFRRREQKRVLLTMLSTPRWLRERSASYV